MLEFRLDQLPVIKSLAADPARPVAGGEEAHQVKLTRLQGFEPRGVVLVDLYRDALEVASTPPYTEVARPVLGIPHIGDVAAELHRADAIRAASNRDVGDDLVKGLCLAVLHSPLAAENGQATDRQRQFAVRLLEAVTHGAFIHYLQARHVLQQILVSGRGVGTHQGVVAVFHVGGQHRVAIMKTRLFMDAEGDRQAI